MSQAGSMSGRKRLTPRSPAECTGKLDGTIKVMRYLHGVLVEVAIFALIGMLFAAAVATGIALAHPNIRGAEGTIRDMDEATARRVWSETGWPDPPPDAPLIAVEHSAPGRRHLTIVYQVSKTQIHVVGRRCFGWPFPFASYYGYTELVDRTTRTSRNTGLAIPSVGAVPTRVRVAPFLLNGFMFGTLGWLLYSGYRFGRRAIRVHQGRCRQCGYRLLPNTVCCSECGTPTPRGSSKRPLE